MTDQLIVTALGSCRVVNPMRVASQTGMGILNNANVYGYVHTPGEILQMIDYFEGLEPPGHVVPYLTGSRTVPSRIRRSEPDIYLVEISSLKMILFHGWYLQLNYFAERLRLFPNLHRSFFDAPFEEQRDRRTIDMVRSSEFLTLPAQDRRVLVDAHVANVTREDLLQHVLALSQRLSKPVLFVTHLDLPDARGNLFESRGHIANWMAEFAEQYGISVFNPTSHILEFGIEAALADNGQSRSHYSSAFEKHLAEILLREMKRVSLLPRISGEAPWTVTPPRRLDFKVDCSTVRDEALQLIRKGDLSGASAAARAAVAEEPPCTRAMSIIAQTALRMGDASAALDFALQTRAVDPAETSAIVVAAKAFTKLRKYEPAAEMWEQMGVYRPTSAWPLVEAARCRLRAKSPEGALDLVSKGLLREPGDVLSLAVKAEALHMLSRWDELVEVGIALAECASDASLAVLQWMVAAKETRGLSRIANAMSGSQDSFTKAPLVQVAHQLRAAAGEAAGQARWDMAGECLRTALALDPADQESAKSLSAIIKNWSEKARSSVKSGALEEALSACEVVLQIDPHHSQALREAAMIAEKQSDWGRAADLWIRYCGDESKDAALLSRTARAAELAGRDEEALGFYRRALVCDPDHAKALASLNSLTRRLAKKGRSLETQGETAAAIKLAAAVLKASPGDPVCAKIIRRQSTHLAIRLREAVNAGDLVRQESLADELLHVDPQRFEALRILSSARLKSGRFDEAAILLRRLTKVQTDVAAHWIKLGRCLRLMKKHEEAREAAREALARDPANRAAHKILDDLSSRPVPEAQRLGQVA